MPDQPLRVIGLPMSPYSLKVRAYLRYKAIPFEWIDRNRRNEKLFQRHARVQLIPLVLFPDGEAMQDSTPIIERLEEEHPEPSIHPETPALRFLSALLEEYGDEWCNKLMFQYRWGPKEDARSAAKRISDAMFRGSILRPLQPLLVPLMIRRMVPRMAFAGANETNAPHLQRSWFRTVECLDAHLADRAYLFGGRPSFADFGIWGNLNQAYSDPTCGRHIRETAPALERWILRMDDPGARGAGARGAGAEGAFEELDTLLPTLGPLLEEQVAGRFLPWSVANEKALAAGEDRTRLVFDGQPYEQKTFKYHAWSLDQLRQKLEPVRDDAALREVLTKTGCAEWLFA